MARSGAKQIDELPHGPRNAPHGQPSVATLGIGSVADEQLVAAVAGEGYRDVASGQLRDQEGRHLGLIAERLVIDQRQLADHVDRLAGADIKLGVTCAEMSRHTLCMARFVERRIREADREGPHRLVGQRLHHRHNRRRVDTTREEGAQWNVRNEPIADSMRSRRSSSSRASA